MLFVLYFCTVNILYIVFLYIVFNCRMTQKFIAVAYSASINLNLVIIILCEMFTSNKLSISLEAKVVTSFLKLPFELVVYKYLLYPYLKNENRFFLPKIGIFLKRKRKFWNLQHLLFLIKYYFGLFYNQVE